MKGEASELEQLLRFVYQCPSAVVRMRRDGAIDLMNAVACGLLLPLCKDGHLTNLLDVLDGVAPSIRPAVAAYERETGTIVDQVQVSLVDAAGRPCVLAITVVAVDAETCVAMINDVTLVVEQQQKLYMQDQRLQAILDSVHDYAIFTLDAGGRIDSYNRSLERLTGMDAASVVGKSLLYLAADPPAQPLEELLGTAKRAGWVEYAASHRGKGDAEIWGEAVVTPILGANDKLNGFGVVLRDGTAKRRYEQELVSLATRDPLTGAANRRAFFAAAEAELSRAGRPDFSVIMLDADHFKSVNDVHGHGVGDQVLKAIAKSCSAQVRATDVLGRLGGEEFAVLAPGATLGEAAALAERIREAIAALEIPVASGLLKLSVSAGVACIPAGSGESFDAALHRADEALYAAKRGGRNRVVTAPG